MPRARRNVVLESGEVFRAGVEEVGFNSYAYTTTGKRKLIRHRVGEKIQVTPAGRTYFQMFKMEVIYEVPVLAVFRNQRTNTLEVRHFTNPDHKHVPITDQRVLDYASSLGRDAAMVAALPYALVGARAADDHIKGQLRAQVEQYLLSLPKVRDVFPDHGDVPGDAIVVSKRYEGALIWDETKPLQFNERITHREKDGHYSVTVRLDRLLNRPLRAPNPHFHDELRHVGPTPLA